MQIMVNADPERATRAIRGSGGGSCSTVRDSPWWVRGRAVGGVAPLIVLLRTHAVALNQAPRRIVEIKTLAAALPIIGIVKKPGAGGVARYPQDEAAIGTGDGFGRHPELVLACREAARTQEMWDLGIPTLGEFGGGTVLGKGVVIGRIECSQLRGDWFGRCATVALAPTPPLGLAGRLARALVTIIPLAGAVSRFKRQRPRRGESEAAEFGWVGVPVRGRPFLYTECG